MRVIVEMEYDPSWHKRIWTAMIWTGEESTSSMGFGDRPLDALCDALKEYVDKCERRGSYEQNSRA